MTEINASSIIIFVDFEYLRLGYREKTQKNLDIDFPKFFEQIAGPRKILQVRIYDTDPEEAKPNTNIPRSSSQWAGYSIKRKTHRILRKYNYLIIKGRVVYRKEDGQWLPHQKGVDVRLAVDVYRSVVREWGGLVFTPVIISGDTDYEHVLRLVYRDYQRKWELWSYENIEYFERLMTKDSSFKGNLKILNDTILVKKTYIN